MNDDMNDALQCTFEDARRNLLRDGIELSTRAKVDWFEEMVALIAHFGAHDRLAEDRGDYLLPGKPQTGR